MQYVLKHPRIVKAWKIDTNVFHEPQMLEFCPQWVQDFISGGHLVLLESGRVEMVMGEWAVPGNHGDYLLDRGGSCSIQPPHVFEEYYIPVGAMPAQCANPPKEKESDAENAAQETVLEHGKRLIAALNHAQDNSKHANLWMFRYACGMAQDKEYDGMMQAVRDTAMDVGRATEALEHFISGLARLPIALSPERLEHYVKQFCRIRKFRKVFQYDAAQNVLQSLFEEINEGRQ